MLSAQDIANYFLTLVDRDEGELLSNLKLQKLLYYSQGFFLALYGKPLFNDPIEAWTHGPVVPEVYHNYKSYGSNALPFPENFDIDKYDSETKNLLNEIYDTYGQYSAVNLRNLTHQEAPWRDTTKGDVIVLDKMKDYFNTQIVQDAQKNQEQSV